MNIITVKFLADEKIADYQIDDVKDISLYDLVIVDSGQIEDLARIINVYEAEKCKNIKGEGKITRKVTKDDKKKIIDNKKEALLYIEKCEEKVKKFNLSMKIVDTDLSFDGKKLTIYFSAGNRIDFRVLVADFVRSFKKLIRLQQIGPREQAAKVDGYGKCGQRVCCARFLKNKDSITLELAKNQNLSETSSNKINGYCGKLMCCLKYEDELYTQSKKKMPNVGQEIKTPQGMGVVIRQNILAGSVSVKLKNAERIEVKI